MTNQKRTVQAGPLSTQMYCAIGMVAASWGHLEEIVSLCLSRLLGCDHIEFLSISGQMQSRNQLDALKTLAAHKLAPDQAAALAGLCEQATTLARERNKVVHGAWLQGDQPNIAIRLTLRTQGRISAVAPTVSAQEVALLADQIITLTGSFGQALQSLGLYDPADPLNRGKE